MRSFRRLKIHSTLYRISLQPENVTSALVPIFIVGMPRSGTTLVEQIIFAFIVGGSESFPLPNDTGLNWLLVFHNLTNAHSENLEKST